MFIKQSESIVAKTNKGVFDYSYWDLIVRNPHVRCKKFIWHIQHKFGGKHCVNPWGDNGKRKWCDPCPSLGFNQVQILQECYQFLPSFIIKQTICVEYTFSHLLPWCMILSLWGYPLTQLLLKYYMWKKHAWGTSPVVQWLRLCASNAGGLGSSPGQGTWSHVL